MQRSDIPRLRLYHTGLSHSPFGSAAEAVSHLGAVQAQDFAAAKWALGLRIKDSTDEDIEKAFNLGTFLRVHVMRPTWHLVMPEDIRWMLGLTASRIKALVAPVNRKLGIDEALTAKSNAAIAHALKGRVYLTRQELKAVLKGAGIETNVQRLAHIIMQAELESLICSGPRRGRQFTYALIDERVPEARKLSREQALAELALKYFVSHGPAQVQDFSWWSGLAIRDAEHALSEIQTKLRPAEFNGKTYWLSAEPKPRIPKPRPALLLSVYDEYALAYKDRSDVSDERDIERMISMGNALTAVIVLDGKAAGTWRKTVKKGALEISLNPFRKLKEEERKALETEAARYGKFIGIAAVVVK